MREKERGRASGVRNVEEKKEAEVKVDEGETCGGGCAGLISGGGDASDRRGKAPVGNVANLRPALRALQ